MTALAGIWNFAGKPDAGAQTARMLAAQAIYGPQAAAIWDGGSVALGSRLFRLLPEDVHDRQPLEGGGRFVLIADVRLDNRDDLGRELGLDAERVRGMADADFILSAWERWVENSFDRLVGDYAFALWDRAGHRLVLARSATGARPLHYHRGRDFLAFASMPKGLHALPEIHRAPDEQRVAEFLALLPESGPQSFFKDVERVEAGHVAIVTANGVTRRRHWQPQRRIQNLRTADEYAEGLRHHLDRAVRDRLRGAGKAVAAHLSAGLDSSIVATSAAIAMAETGGKVFAFTAVPREGYDGPVPRRRLADEGPIAAKTAALHPNMEHVLVRTNAQSPFRDLDRQFFLYDRPLLNICNAVWMNAIDDAAQARKLSVLMPGQFGNLSLTYDGLTLLPNLLARGRLLAWLRQGTGVVRNGHMRWSGMLSQSIGPYLPDFAWRLALAAFGKASQDVTAYSGISAARIQALALRDVARNRALDLDYRPRSDGFASRLWALDRVDLGNVNKGVLAGWGIDQRDPTSDRRLIEFSLAIPEEQFLVNGEIRALARRAFASRMAPEVTALKLRGYQAADWHEGLTAARDSAREEVERMGDCAPAATALDLSRLAGLVENMPKSGWAADKVIAPYRLALLRAIATGHFLRRASGSNA